MTIRFATPDDVENLARLHRAIFPHAPWDEGFWAETFGRPFDKALLHADPPSGLALVRLLGDDAELLTLGTTVRRQGHGQSLLMAVVNLAAAATAKHLFLEVSALNKAAIHLYRRVGFVQTGVRPAYYADGSDAQTMRLDLSDEGDTNGPARENLR